MVPFSTMKTSVFSKRGRAPVRLGASALAVLAAFSASSVLAQGQTQVVLKDVVVTATRFAEPAASLPMGVSVISSSDIERTGAVTVNEAISKLLGVPARLDTSGGNNYTLDLRGFGEAANSNQVVIIDGLRLNEGDFSVAGLSSIPVESIERIEVLRGSGAVLYGEGATGGVIVITTKAASGAQRRDAAQVYGATGSNGLQEVRATAVLSAGNWSLDVAADDRRSDNHRANFASTNQGLGATAQWSNDWLRMGLRGGRNDQHSGLPGSLSTAQYAANPWQADPSRSSALADYGDVSKDHAGVFIEADVAHWNLVAEANQRTKKYMSLQFGSMYGYDVDSSNTSLRARYEAALGVNHLALVGGYDQDDWKRTLTASTFTPVGTAADAKSEAYYLKSDLTLAGAGTRLSAGWRTSAMNKNEGTSVSALDETQNAWELAVSQPLYPGLTAYARWGNSFRLANVDEFSFTTPGVAIQAQTSHDFELGARWALKSSQVNLRWYRSDLSNEIGYDPSANGPYGPGSGANINYDPTRRQGLEVDVRQGVSAALDLSLNAALRQAIFQSGPYSGNDVPLVPVRTLGLQANWRPVAGHSLNAGVMWVSEQHPGGDFANAFKMPSYTTVDVRYAYQYKKAELALGIANLLDARYYSLAYLNFLGTDVGVYPEAGRTVTASLRMKF